MFILGALLGSFLVIGIGIVCGLALEPQLITIKRNTREALRIVGKE